MGTLAAGEGERVAIFNRNEPAFFCMPVGVFETLIEKREDMELNAIADARVYQEEIAVSPDEL